MSLTLRGPALPSAGLRSSGAAFERGLSRIGSGVRILGAADDAAGLAISERMRARVTGSTTATRNVQTGIDLLQTADGGLSAVTSLLHRARELAVQAASTGSMTAADREAAAAEVQQLVEEVDRIAVATRYNGHGLLDGSRPLGWVLQVGADDGDTLRIDLPDRGATALGLRGASGVTTTSTTTTTYSTKSAQIYGYDPTTDGGTFTVSVDGGPAVTVQLTTTKAYAADELSRLRSDLQAALPAGLGVTVGLSNRKLSFSTGDPAVRVDVTGSGARALAITTAATSTVTASSTPFSTADLVGLVRAGSDEAMTVVDTALDRVSGTRTHVGATQNRLEHRLAVLAATAGDLGSARSRLLDTDIAKERMGMVRAQVLTQSATAVQAQAVASGQHLLRLLAPLPVRGA